MRRLTVVLAMLLVPVGLRAQVGADSATQAATLRQLIRARWHEHIVTQLGLDQGEAAKLQATEDKFDGLRQPIQQRQVAIAAELNHEMQPGVAADNAVVTRLLAEREQNRARLQELERQQDQEMAGYLTPVQRVRYQRQRELFIKRVQQFREGRMARRGRRLR